MMVSRVSNYLSIAIPAPEPQHHRWSFWADLWFQVDSSTRSCIMDPTRRSEGSVNMAETVKLMAQDGVEVEANVKAVMAGSGFLRNLIEQFGTDATIHVPLLSGSLSLAIEWCEAPYVFDLGLGFNKVFPADRVDVVVSEDRQPALTGRTRDLPDSLKLNDQEAHDLERFHWEICGTKFVNEHCSKFDGKTIKGLHEAAKFLDIPSLLRLTTPLIREAPSREFMGVVSPWLDYDTWEAYRNHEMAVC